MDLKKFGVNKTVFLDTMRNLS